MKQSDSREKIELNFFYLHKNDALKFAELASKESSKIKSLYARHSILSVVFAIEALINKFLDDFYLLTSGFDSIEQLSIPDKLFVAPLVCGITDPFTKTLDKSKEPFQSVTELVKIRNWMVHPKEGHFVNARTVSVGSIRIVETGEELPWVETEKGSVWSQTRIPVNPFELSEDHAKIALKILDQVISELNQITNGLITEKWLDEIELKDSHSSKTTKVTIQSLWGGYTPDKTILG